MKISSCCFFTTFLFLLFQAEARDNVPKLINYQGKLTNATGQALTDGTYKLRFGIYSKKDSAQAGDSLVWGTDYNVTVMGGQFNVVLGAGGGTPVAGAAVNDIGFAFTDPERYVQLTVLTDHTGIDLPAPQVLLPRQQLLSTPYAIQAQTALHGVPPGTVVSFAGTDAPEGWTLCDGQPRNGNDTKFAKLFNTIGLTYGGTGTTFNVPDMRGRVLAGRDDMGSLAANRLTSAGSGVNGAVLGAAGGNQSHLLTSNQSGLRSHSHSSGSLYVKWVGMSVNQSRYVAVGTEQWQANSYVEGGKQFTSNSLHTTGVATGGSTGGENSVSSSSGFNAVETHPIVQPTLILNYIIKL